MCDVVIATESSREPLDTDDSLILHQPDYKWRSVFQFVVYLDILWILILGLVWVWDRD